MVSGSGIFLKFCQLMMLMEGYMKILENLNYETRGEGKDQS